MTKKEKPCELYGCTNPVPWRRKSKNGGLGQLMCQSEYNERRFCSPNCAGKWKAQHGIRTGPVPRKPVLMTPEEKALNEAYNMFNFGDA